MFKVFEQIDKKQFLKTFLKLFWDSFYLNYFLNRVLIFCVKWEKNIRYVTTFSKNIREEGNFFFFCFNWFALKLGLPASISSAVFLFFLHASIKQIGCQQECFMLLLLNVIIFEACEINVLCLKTCFMSRISLFLWGEGIRKRFPMHNCHLNLLNLLFMKKTKIANVEIKKW